MSWFRTRRSPLSSTPSAHPCREACAAHDVACLRQRQPFALWSWAILVFCSSNNRKQGSGLPVKQVALRRKTPWLSCRCSISQKACTRASLLMESLKSWSILEPHPGAEGAGSDFFVSLQGQTTIHRRGGAKPQRGLRALTAASANRRVGCVWMCGFVRADNAYIVWSETWAIGQ